MKKIALRDLARERSSEIDIREGKVDSMTDRTTAQIAAQHIAKGSASAYSSHAQGYGGSGVTHDAALRAATKFTIEQIVAQVSAISFESNSPEFDRGARWAQAELRRMINDIARAPLPNIK